jgi:EAL domain-containing protein (putative c-di-GMP-specific phosphodiesterase class I)
MEDSSLLRRKDQIRWVNRIQSALREDRFRLYAQLIHPLNSGSEKPHFEVLLRMEDEDGSLVAPERYIAAAENFYLMSSIDYWVVNRTFEELARYRQPSSACDCQISVNLSGQSLSDTDSFAAYIENKFEHSGVNPGDICFEITESAAIANIEDAQTFIDQVHALGCKFSLDDFGTGLSSFAYLKNLKVDYLKIDGSFVRDIVKDPVCESMVSAINQVGQAMKLKTVAEFVENEEIARKLKQIGVDFGQGFGLGVPAPLSDTLANLAKPKSKSA